MSELDFTRCKSHRARRLLLRRWRRRKQRQTAAKEREQMEIQVEQQRMNSPRYRAIVDARKRVIQHEEDEEKRRNERESEAWKRYDQNVVVAWNHKKEREKQEELRREEQERLIREEWEQKQAKENAKLETQDALLKQATAHARTSSQNEGDSVEAPWHNPFAPPGEICESHNPTKSERCPFFYKTGACRFGDRCSRVHPQCTGSACLLFVNMFSNIQLDGNLPHEDEQDASLEFEESDMQSDYNDFYSDVYGEFEKFGHVTVLKTAANFEPHLRGNVYVQFDSEADATDALKAISGRWYAGRQVYGKFVNIRSWNEAICGLFFKKRCPRGKHCNFLHVFRNPGETERDWFSRRSFRRGGESASRRESSYVHHRNNRRRESSSSSSSPPPHSHSHRRSHSCERQRERSPRSLSRYGRHVRSTVRRRYPPSPPSSKDRGEHRNKNDNVRSNRHREKRDRNQREPKQSSKELKDIESKRQRRRNLTSLTSESHGKTKRKRRKSTSSSSSGGRRDLHDHMSISSSK